MVLQPRNQLSAKISLTGAKHQIATRAKGAAAPERLDAGTVSAFQFLEKNSGNPGTARRCSKNLIFGFESNQKNLVPEPIPLEDDE